MNGTLAHALALALHGSAWLAEPSGPPPELDDGPTFRYLEQVRFTQDGAVIADRPAAWLRGLRDEGIGRIWFTAPQAEARTVGGEPVADHLLVAFAGAGRWALVTQGAGGAVAWPASWEVGDHDAPDQRIWQVEYQAHRTAPLPPPARPLLASAEVLRSALVEIDAFARSNGSEWWSDAFAEALQGFSDPEPSFPHYPDVLPDALNLQRRRLASVAARSWVFGGMGSWNDQGFSDAEVQAENDRVTAQLYGAALDAFTAVVNAP